MLMRFFVIAVLLVILYCLGSALFFLIKQPQSDCMVKALSWRIGLSVALFIFLLATYFLGWITPHGI